LKQALIQDSDPSSLKADFNQQTESIKKSLSSIQSLPQKVDVSKLAVLLAPHLPSLK